MGAHEDGPCSEQGRGMFDLAVFVLPKEEEGREGGRSLDLGWSWILILDWTTSGGVACDWECQRIK